MTTAAITAILVVAILHAGFLVLEMFLWTKPFGRKTFGLTSEFSLATQALAANQGLYNGFLAAGLAWSVLDGTLRHDLAVFFLGCVIIAGAFGAATVNLRIFFVQAMPAGIAMTLVLLA